MHTRFEWDETKNRKNRNKHVVWFEEAATVFADDDLRVYYDEAHSGREDRFVALGRSSLGRILVVVHCYRKPREIVRIISARVATRRERAWYEEGI